MQVKHYQRSIYNIPMSRTPCVVRIYQIYLQYVALALSEELDI